MKNNDSWKADADTILLMQQTIAKWHPTLALVDKNIAVVMRAKAAKSGGDPVLGVARKAPPILSVLTDGEYEFILEIAADEWQTLTNNQREALMDHLLSHCKVEEEEGTGDVKCSINKPDVFFFYDELKR
ncbi:MAG: putative metallopeptidase, partial [Terrimicrobiaceae bacterium]